VTIAWYPGFTHHVTWAALWDFMTAFQERGTAAWDDFVASRQDRPYPHPEMPPDGEGADKQRALEDRYLSVAALAKYRREGWRATVFAFSTATRMSVPTRRSCTRI